MLIFNPETGFAVDDIATVRSQVATAWINAFHKDGQVDLNTDPETPAGQLIDSETASICEKDAELLYLCNQFDPFKNEGVFQDAIGRIYFLTRKKAIASSVKLTVTGLAGTVIPVNAQVQSTADGTIWQADASITIGANGTAEGNFKCMAEGAISASAGTITQIMTVVAGWDTATNNDAATVGSLEENRGSFEFRRYASVALNSRGTAASVYARLMQLDGVIGVLVRENRASSPKVIDSVTLSPHSVFIAVLGGLDARIAETIYKTISAGCDTNGGTTYDVTDENTGVVETIKFERPASINVYVRARFSNVTLLSADNIKAIREAIYNNFYGLDPTEVNGSIMPRYTMGDDIYAPRFSISIQNLGFNTLLNLDVSLDGSTWSDKVHIDIDKNPVLNTSNIVVE